MLPEGVPLRVRAEGLRLLARQRMPERAASPPPDEVYAPMVAQAELDLRAGQPQVALPRLDFVLGRLPAGSPLEARARDLRAHAASMLGVAPPPPSAAPPSASPPPELPGAPEPARDGHRGTTEIVDLYISAAAVGALTGGWIPFVASGNTATTATYILTTAAGAGLLAVGVLTLDLTTQLASGVPTTIASSIRFGIAHGLLTMGLYLATPASGLHDDELAFTLLWGGAMTGTVVGLGVAFGLTPTVREARFVESMGYWGAALGTYAAMLTDYADVSAGLALTLGDLDLALVAGMILASVGALPSTERTLWLDLGFAIGAGIGALIPGLYFATEEGAQLVYYPFGIGMLIGSVGGWLLAYLFTEERGASGPEPPVAIGIAPLEGGAALAANGSF